jgi:hypothetical protein
MPDVAHGQYQILADVVQTAATDASTSNNAAAAYGSYTIAKPFVDLNGWFKTAPTAIGAKGAFCTLQIKNDGNVKASGPLNVKYYLSTDATLDGADQEMVSFSKFANVQSGKTSVRKQKLTLPEGTAAGQYYLIATINSDNAILESVLSNNHAFSATPITV